ncbi:undecaprenyl-phosphate glucose phosphotransferase [Psychromonas sp. B3M02]|uniref:undecaprenyl-phosphate glucose phosphotransferase n=1 Tax=Psychromonas sp. B3M02 TaxID=2267226 RepID=UPI000DE9BCE2|nr:undecaprenyl-phosphate glucose phosphotransferase [Psychromonas sp. B3M02]RBW47711.1 undecaprenyl-phosphate glucose phosphotransferase [Psychromonas sp. B3M02]
MSEPRYVKDSANAYSALYRCIDFLIIQTSLFLILSLREEAYIHTYLVVGLIASIGFLFAAESYQLYRCWRLGEFSRIASYTFLCWVAGVFCVVIFLFFSKTSLDISRLIVGLWIVFNSIALAGWRFLLYLFLYKRRQAGFYTRKVAIFGLTQSGVLLAEQFINKPETGYILTGFYDDRADTRSPTKYKEHLLGGINQGIELAKAGGIEVIYIALPLAAQKRIEGVLRSLGDTTIDVFIVPDFFTFNLLNARLSHLGAIQTISVYESPMTGPSRLLKRLEDILGSLVILTIIALPMLLIALLIKIDSRGPVLFKQLRYGLDGRAIQVWKFRSMHSMENGKVVNQAVRNDVRITKLGAILRQTSLDELPQFINVLFGSMSLVGPRPHAVAHNEEYRKLVDYYMLRHKVKPGITGWAQINGWRGETDTLVKMQKRVEFDLEYIRNWSISFDLKIICLTIVRGFRDKNAY